MGFVFLRIETDSPEHTKSYKAQCELEWVSWATQASPPCPAMLSDCLSAALSSHGPRWFKLWSEDWFLGLTLVLPCHLDLPGYVWPWLPALGFILICWLVLLAKPQTWLSPWSFLVIWTVFLKLSAVSGPAWYCGVVRPMSRLRHSCSWLPAAWAAAAPAAPF